MGRVNLCLESFERDVAVSENPYPSGWGEGNCLCYLRTLLKFRSGKNLKNRSLQTSFFLRKEDEAQHFLSFYSSRFWKT